MKKTISRLLIVAALSACQTVSPPPPLIGWLDNEFVLAPGQTAEINGTDLSITLISVPGDGRCPLDIECTESGPVTITMEVQVGSGVSQEFVLQAFTDTNGRVPEGPFEGMQDRVEHDGYLIRVRGVLPFPQTSASGMEEGEYRVSFLVSR
ncbi:MAG: hypothetical protein JETCAE01_32320 [Anaerolineaceae bacterium]|nr:MAG: hypothetical protein JETCAE01_32320 [Anaerolineaceae bacterium]